MAYKRVNWENLPSTKTPVNADNLNKMDEGIANAVEKTGDTLTGDLDMQSNSVKFGKNGNVLWKKDGYGDKFRIIPNFNGAGANNKLIIQSTTGEAGTDPQNWKDLVYIHADTGEINLIDILTCNRIRTNKIDLNNGAFAPRCFQLAWGTTLIANTEVGGHGLIMASDVVLYMFWIAGPNHDQLSVKKIWGDSNYCQVTMTDNAHLKVTNINGDSMTCSILFIRGN